MKFKDLKLSKELFQTINKLGFVEPTEIQEKSIPYIIEGKDVIGESATGSGKTLAFGCGIVEQVVSGKGLQSLILTPTRELAEQVKNEIIKFSSSKNLKVSVIYGGVSINPQIEALTKANVVIATPGRLLDHLQRRTINLSKVKLLVLDEADRMLDMGFIDDIRKIISQCPKDRQTLFFSATIPSMIKKLAHKYMKDPIQINAVKYVDPKKLKQVYYDVAKNLKLSLLIHLLHKEKSGLIMVFCNTRRTVDFVVKNLKANKIDAVSIHGGLTQNKRSQTLKKFDSGKSYVLVCTDVAARGLHISNVSHIYNYEIPKDSKDYIHRIGRTARAGKYGKVVNLLCEYDHDNFGRLLNNYRNLDIEKLKKPYLERILFVKGENFHHNKRNSKRKYPPSKKRFSGHKRRSNDSRRN